MKIRRETFDIISLKGGEKEYYPSQEYIDSLKEYLTQEELASMCVYSDMNIPLGHSRYGGCVIDIPRNGTFPIAHEEFDHPVNDTATDDSEGVYLRFAAQLDLGKVGALDRSGLLPKHGQLYFFADIYSGKCKVVYSNVTNDELERIWVKHEDNFYNGRLITEFEAEKESFDDRFRQLNEEEGELECFDCGADFRVCDCNSEHNTFKPEDLTEDGRVWDQFSGAEKSKIYGIFSHCQWNSSEIEEMTFSDKIVLLQIGENDFNENAVFCVSITKQDLQKLNFDHCECYWAQT